KVFDYGIVELRFYQQVEGLHVEGRNLENPAVPRNFNAACDQSQIDLVPIEQSERLTGAFGSDHPDVETPLPAMEDHLFQEVFSDGVAWPVGDPECAERGLSCGAVVVQADTHQDQKHHAEDDRLLKPVHEPVRQGSIGSTCFAVSFHSIPLKP